jgi:hypothetical protein
VLPIHPGRCGTMTHDYKRNGTTTLFAALELAEGKVIGTCMDRHRHQEWIKFLKRIDAQTPPELDLHLNEPARPFVWTAKADDILEKVQRARAVLDKTPSE